MLNTVLLCGQVISQTKIEIERKRAWKKNITQVDLLGRVISDRILADIAETVGRTCSPHIFLENHLLWRSVKSVTPVKPPQDLPQISHIILAMLKLHYSEFNNNHCL